MCVINNCHTPASPGLSVCASCYNVEVEKRHRAVMERDAYRKLLSLMFAHSTDSTPPPLKDVLLDVLSRTVGVLDVDSHELERNLKG